MQANGSFEVKMSPLDVYNQSPAAKIGRLSIDKTFDGDLVATSQGRAISPTRNGNTMLAMKPIADAEKIGIIGTLRPWALSRRIRQRWQRAYRT